MVWAVQWNFILENNHGRLPWDFLSHDNTHDEHRPIRKTPLVKIPLVKIASKKKETGIEKEIV